jgi:hypothetical protein
LTIFQYLKEVVETGLVTASLGALSTAATLQISMAHVSLDCFLGHINSTKVSFIVTVTNIHLDLFQQTPLVTAKASFGTIA